MIWWKDNDTLYTVPCMYSQRHANREFDPQDYRVWRSITECTSLNKKVQPWTRAQSSRIVRRFKFIASSIWPRPRIVVTRKLHPSRPFRGKSSKAPVLFQEENFSRSPTRGKSFVFRVFSNFTGRFNTLSDLRITAGGTFRLIRFHLVLSSQMVNIC